jgi:hypothetical protein
MGLMDYRARFYDPLLMRFIQPDSMVPSPANPQGFNRYTYVGNSPINFSDPSGNTSIDQIKAMKKAYGKHLWGQYSKAWNRSGGHVKLPDWTPKEPPTAYKPFSTLSLYGLRTEGMRWDITGDGVVVGGKPLSSLTEFPPSPFYCEWIDCGLSVASLLLSGVATAFLGVPEIAGVAVAADVVVTLIAVGRTEAAYSLGEISNTRRKTLNITGLVGLVPIIGLGTSLGNMIFTFTGYPR